jgi:hypothetical protein
MATHPAIRALKREIARYDIKADELTKAGLTATAYNIRQEAEGLERAIAVIEPWLGGRSGL